MINIEKNNYSVPTEVREEVVQAICDAFLSCCCWSTFHSNTTSPYRKATLYVIKHKDSKKYHGFRDEVFSSEEGIKIRGVEMKRAFQELHNAGYHMFLRYHYGDWKGYECSRYPFQEGCQEVFEFTDFID